MRFLQIILVFPALFAEAMAIASMLACDDG